MKLLIADDSELFRERFVKMLSRSPEIEIIGQARDVVETKSLILELKPDIVGSVTELPINDGEFDVALCCQVLEHLPLRSHRYPLARAHGERPGEQPGDPREQHDLRVVGAARHAHHEAEV